MVTGKKVYRGIPCFVVERRMGKRSGLDRWYIGEQTGFLHGRDVRNVAWIPRWEYWLLDYVEVKPGCWFPKTQGWVQFLPKWFSRVIDSQKELKATAVTANDALPGSLFQRPAIPEGAMVFDQTSNPPLDYRYKADRTPAEWAALLENARKVHGEQEAVRRIRDALVGKPAPPFPQATWLNSRALRWEDLRGKQVVLMFWAEGCVPCKSHLSHLRKARSGSRVVPIGIHTPTEDHAEVEKVIAAFGVTAPVCIDSPNTDADRRFVAGQLFSAFKVGGIPYAVLVDTNGNVAAHGPVNEMFNRAYARGH